MNVNEHIPYRIARLVHSFVCRKAGNESRNTIFGWQLRGCNLSKITDLLAIPIGFLAIKALQGKVKDEVTAPEVQIADPFIKPLDIGPIGFVGPLIGGGGTQNGGPTPTGPGTGLGFGIDYEDIGVPIFPETAADFEPSNGTNDIAKLKDFKYKELEFDAWWLK